MEYSGWVGSPTPLRTEAASSKTCRELASWWKIFLNLWIFYFWPRNICFRWTLAAQSCDWHQDKERLHRSWWRRCCRSGSSWRRPCPRTWLWPFLIGECDVGNDFWSCKSGYSSGNVCFECDLFWSVWNENVGHWRGWFSKKSTWRNLYPQLWP